MTQQPIILPTSKGHTRIGMLHLTEGYYFSAMLSLQNAMLSLQIMRTTHLISQIQRLIAWHAADEPADHESHGHDEWREVSSVLAERLELAKAMLETLKETQAATNTGSFLPDYNYNRG